MNRKNDQLELLAKQCLGRAKENERLLKRLRCLQGMSQSLMLDVSFYACMQSGHAIRSTVFSHVIVATNYFILLKCAAIMLLF